MECPFPCARFLLSFLIILGGKTQTKGFHHGFLSPLQDVDECAPPAEPCGRGHRCVNSPGSFRCECKTGYYFDGISRMCVGAWGAHRPWGNPATWHQGHILWHLERCGLILISDNPKCRQTPREDPESGDPILASAVLLPSRAAGGTAPCM